MKYLSKFLYATLCLGLTCPHLASAQADEADFLYSVATSRENSGGESYAYLYWTATEPQALLGNRYAIYQKTGGIDSISAYQRQGIVEAALDRHTIGALLQHSRNLGQDLNSLSEDIDNLFGGLIDGVTGLSLEEKILTVVVATMDSPTQFENLQMLSRRHPGLAMVMGQAYATRISANNKSTFEIRRYSTSSGEDLRVVGRMEVDPTVSDRLPAPGAPFKVEYGVPDSYLVNDTRGHLNVRLRWAVPTTLRERSLKQFGFNVYRAPKQLVDSSGLSVSGPDHQAFLAFIAQNDAARKLNDLPLLTGENLSPAEVADASDHETFFFADDNDRFSGGEPFEDGDQFYYWVAARDVLGRPGLLSPGTLVTVCDRLPPKAPKNIRVENQFKYDGGQSEQYLSVSWEQVDGGNGDEAAANYYVYRWESVEEINRMAGDPSQHRVVGPIPADPSKERLRFDDRVSPNNPDAPTMADDEGVTYFYTIRAEDDSACGGNLSGNSSPIYGVLRDREGPDAPSGSIMILCPNPVVTDAEPVTFNPADRGIQANSIYQMRVYRRPVAQPEAPIDKAIDWAEFLVFDPNTGEEQTLARTYYGPGQAFVSQLVAPPVSGDLAVRVGTADGTASSLAHVSPPVFDKDGGVEVRFEAAANLQRTATGGVCDTHLGRTPGKAGEPGGDINDIYGSLNLTSTTNEWKVYRRVDDADLTLVAQDLDSYEDVTSVNWVDAGPRPSGTRVCYYGQLYDENGNPSQLIRLGCTTIANDNLPVPMLSRPEPQERAQPTDPVTAKLEWFCSPVGVSRFEVLVAPAQDDRSVGEDISASLSSKLDETGVNLTEREALEDFDFTVYQTPAIGNGFGSEGVYSVNVELESAREYVFVVRAVGEGMYPGRPSGNPSQARRFMMRESSGEESPEVPWPARPVPAAIGPDLPGGGQLVAENLANGVGIRIGAFTAVDPLLSGEGTPLPVDESNTRYELEAHEFLMGVGQEPADALTVPLLPFAVYRYQSDSTVTQGTSGAVVQVTPKMESIAHQQQWEARDAKGEDIPSLFLTRVLDPFFDALLTGNTASDPGPTHHLYLRDQHPVIEGATYRYVFVIFDEYGEIDRLIQSTEVTIPES